MAAGPGAAWLRKKTKPERTPDAPHPRQHWRFGRKRASCRTVLVIRRLTDRHRAYTGIFLPGEPPRIFSTSDAEHGRILQIYKQDRPHEGVINDFSEFALGRDTLSPPPPAPVARP
jgi:hypothetical protein